MSWWLHSPPSLLPTGRRTHAPRRPVGASTLDQLLQDALMTLEQPSNFDGGLRSDPSPTVVPETSLCGSTEPSTPFGRGLRSDPFLSLIPETSELSTTFHDMILEESLFGLTELPELNEETLQWLSELSIETESDGSWDAIYEHVVQPRPMCSTLPRGRWGT